VVDLLNVMGECPLSDGVDSWSWKLSLEGVYSVRSASLMKINKLDAVVTPFSFFSSILAIGGYLGVIVPAGYEKGQPFGICFGGLKGSEPKLIEIAYSFEQATLIRKPPPLRKLEVTSLK